MSEVKLQQMLEEFEAAAKEVQGGLLSRDSETIYRAIERQEKSVEEMNSVFAAHTEFLKQVIDGSPAIRAILDRVQTLVRINRTLTTRFLSIMEQTFSQMGRSSSRAYAGYEGASQSAPLLVSQQG